MQKEKKQQDHDLEKKYIIERNESLERINTKLAVENTNLLDEIERLTFLLQKKEERQKVGYIEIDIDYIIALLYFERYYMKQSRCRLVYQDQKFLRMVPDYDLKIDSSIRNNFIVSTKNQVDQQKKINENFDSVV